MLQERRYVVTPEAQQSDDLACRTIPQLQPDDLWRRPENHAQPVKIPILAHEHQAVVACMVPDRQIRGAEQTDIAHMD